MSGSIDGTTVGPVAFTSENGVRAAHDIWEGPKGRAYAVGDRTAEVAIGLGWQAVSAGGNARDLAALIGAKAPQGRVLWPCGQVVKSDLEKAGKRLGVRVDPKVVYTMHKTGAEDEIRELVETAGRVVLPVFSPAAAKAMAGCLEGAVNTIHLVAISDDVAAAFGPAGAVDIAKAPNATEMIRAISEIFPRMSLEGGQRDV